MSNYYRKNLMYKMCELKKDKRSVTLQKITFIFFLFSVNGTKYISSVKCTKSKCSPKVAGPSNACMYICGKIEC